MLYNRTTLEYTINALRRHIQDEFPDLTIHFVLRSEVDAAPVKQALKKMEGHPAVDEVRSFLAQHTPNKIEMSALVVSRKVSFTHPFGKETYLAICQIDVDALHEEAALVFLEAPNRYEQVICYSLGWQAIEVLRGYQSGAFGSSPKKVKIIKPQRGEMKDLRANLLGECFAVMFMEQYGERGMILQVMKRRCELVLEKHIGYYPERYPLPIAIDAVRLIFRDLGHARPEGHSLVRHALEMVEEIEGTIDDIGLRQWVEFCLAVQEMAWNECTRHEILSAATYSSDDAYMRTTAYIIAEALNTDVTPLNNPQFYNPFADSERFMRMHNKAAMAKFEQIFHQAKEENKPELFVEQAIKDNERLLEGQIIGWCVPGLIKACHSMNKENAQMDMIPLVFQKALDDIPWNLLVKLGRYMMLKRRVGQPLSPSIILEEFVTDSDEMTSLREALTVG